MTGVRDQRYKLLLLPSPRLRTSARLLSRKGSPDDRPRSNTTIATQQLARWTKLGRWLVNLMAILGHDEKEEGLLPQCSDMRRYPRPLSRATEDLDKGEHWASKEEG